MYPRYCRLSRSRCSRCRSLFTLFRPLQMLQTLQTLRRTRHTRYNNCNQVNNGVVVGVPSQRESHCAIPSHFKSVRIFPRSNAILTVEIMNTLLPIQFPPAHSSLAYICPRVFACPRLKYIAVFIFAFPFLYNIVDYVQQTTSTIRHHDIRCHHPPPSANWERLSYTVCITHRLVVCFVFLLFCRCPTTFYSALDHIEF